MSTSKHIDIICVVVLVFTLLLTMLFVNGKALGLTPVTDGDAGDGDSPFTANDLNGDWSAANATRITLTGDGGRVSGSGAYILDGDVHILYAGAYVLSGELTDGSVIIGVILLIFVNRKSHSNPYIVVLQCDGHKSEEAARAYLEQNTLRCAVKSKSAQAGRVELNLEVRLRDDNTDFINALSAMPGVGSAVLVSYNGDYMG